MFYPTAKFTIILAMFLAVWAPISVAAQTPSKAVKTLLKTNECPKCDLSKANLSKSTLYEANLEGANLKRADLTDANLEKVNLKGADLRQADLTGSTLKGAFCRLTNFDGAKMPDGKPFSITNNPKKYGCRR